MSWWEMMWTMLVWCVLLRFINLDVPLWLWAIFGPGLWAYIVWVRYQLWGAEWRKR